MVFVLRRLTASPCGSVVATRLYRRYEHPYYLELYRRRALRGPEPAHRRWEYPNWNYSTELYAFGQRLGEPLSEALLTRAFTFPSYQAAKLRHLAATFERSALAPAELMRYSEPLRRDLVSQADIETLPNNEALVQHGQRVIDEFVQLYLQCHFPRLPPDGLAAIHRAVTDHDVFATVAAHLGVGDLVFCEEPDAPSRHTLALTLPALVAAVDEELGRERAQLFVGDFLLPQLIGKDLFELWPMADAAALLRQAVGSDVEVRQLWQSGQSTVMGLWWAGVYRGTQLLGKAPGESAAVAADMAARDALKRHFGMSDSLSILTFGAQLRPLVRRLQPHSAAQKVANKLA